MNYGDVCIPNIDARGQAQRARGGWIGLAATAIVIVIVAAVDAPRLLRVGLFIPAVLSAAGVIQAREKT